MSRESGMDWRIRGILEDILTEKLVLEVPQSTGGAVYLHPDLREMSDERLIEIAFLLTHPVMTVFDPPTFEDVVYPTVESVLSDCSVFTKQA